MCNVEHKKSSGSNLVLREWKILFCPLCLSPWDAEVSVFPPHTANLKYSLNVINATLFFPLYLKVYCVLTRNFTLGSIAKI